MGGRDHYRALHAGATLHLFIVGFGVARRRQMTLWPLAIAAFLYGAYNMTFRTLPDRAGGSRTGR